MSSLRHFTTRLLILCHLKNFTIVFEINKHIFRLYKFLTIHAPIQTIGNIVMY